MKHPIGSQMTIEQTDGNGVRFEIAGETWTLSPLQWQQTQALTGNGSIMLPDPPIEDQTQMDM